MRPSTNEPPSADAASTPGPRVYLDRDAITVRRPADDRRVGATQEIVPGAGEALRYLFEARCDIVLVGRLPTELLHGLGVPVRFSGNVEAGEGATFLITADPASCEHERTPGVTSILVGPHRPPGPRPTAHCDIEARDLATAVMEILTHEAMTA